MLLANLNIMKSIVCVALLSSSLTILAQSAPERVSASVPYWEKDAMTIYCESPYENALMLPGGFSHDYTVEYVSSNPSVVEYVESKICVVGHQAGTAVITGTVTMGDGQVYATNLPVTVVVPQANSRQGNKLIFDKYYYTVSDDKTAAFYTSSDVGKEFLVPGKISDGSNVYTVTSIGEGAFKNSSIEKVAIPVSTKIIGSSAFANCYSFKEIQFFKITNVEEIGNKAFFQCSNLTDPEFPATLAKIGDFAYMECFAVKKFDFGSNLSQIGKGAFAGCLNLQIFNVRSNNYFAVLSPLNDGGPGVLFTKDYKELVAYPNKIRDYWWIYSFDDEDPYEIYNRVQKIRPYAFNGCTYLRAVTIPTSVTEIGEYAFNGCSGLGEISLPAGITRIEDHCFAYCESLEKVTVQSGLTYVGKSAFPTTGPKEFRCPATVPPTAALSEDPTTDSFCDLPSNATLYVPQSSIQAYKTAAIWSYYPQVEALPSVGVQDITTDLIEPDNDGENAIYTIDGKYVGTDTKNLPSGIYVNKKGDKFVVK